MGMTIAEKIIAAAAGVDSVKPGDIYTVSLDHLMSNDGTTHLTVDMYNNKLKNPHIADTKKLVFIVDHNVPSDSPKTAASQKKMRDFARENNIDFWEGKGVCHQIMIENYVRPGQLESPVYWVFYQFFSLLSLQRNCRLSSVLPAKEKLLNSCFF